MKVISWKPLGVLAAATTVLVACAHGQRCTTPRPVPPQDTGTRAAIEGAGGRYEICPDGYSYMVTRPGTRELTEDEYEDIVKRGLPDRLPTPLALGWGIGPTACVAAVSRPTGLVGTSYWEVVTPGEVMAGLERLAGLADVRDVTLRARFVLPDPCSKPVLDERVR